MKVAMICQPWDPVHPPVTSGSVAIWVYEVSRRLAKSCDITVFAQHAPGDQPTQVYEGVTFRRLALGRTGRMAQIKHRLFGRPSRDRPFFASSYFTRDFICNVAREIAAQQFDIVHIQNYSQFVPVVRKLNPNARIILHMRCEWLLQLDRHMIAERLNHADLVVNVGGYLKNATRERFPDVATPIETLANGIDINELARTPSRADTPDPSQNGTTSASITRAEPDQSMTLLFVSRISPEKGVHDLLSAFERVHAVYPTCKLRVIGPPGGLAPELMLDLSNDPLIQQCAEFFRNDYLAMLKAQMSPAIVGAVEFLGHVPHDQLGAHYRDSALVVAPSLSEAFGRAVIEAMACGVPVVGSAVGGIAETIVDGETGLLVPPADPGRLAKAILELLGDPQRRIQMGRNALQRVREHYSWESITQQTLAYYEGLVEGEQITGRKAVDSTVS